MDKDLVPDPDALAALCHRHHIRRLSIFGSAIHGELTDQSDLDVLVEFETGCTPGLAFFRIQRELSELLGRPVDLNTPEDLSPHFRNAVMREAQVQFVAA